MRVAMRPKAFETIVQSFWVGVLKLQDYDMQASMYSTLHTTTYQQTYPLSQSEGVAFRFVTDARETELSWV